MTRKKAAVTRDYWAYVYLNAKEKRRLKAYADEVGLQLGTAIRNLALRKLREEEKG